MLLDLLMGESIPIRMLCDSRCAIDAVTAGYSAKMRYSNRTMGVSLAWLKEQFVDKLQCIQYCPTKDQAADLFTKGLDEDTFVRLRTFVGQLSPEAAKCAQCSCTRCESAIALSPSHTSRCRFRAVPGTSSCAQCSEACECACWTTQRLCEATDQLKYEQ